MKASEILRREKARGVKNKKVLNRQVRALREALLGPLVRKTRELIAKGAA